MKTFLDEIAVLEIRFGIFGGVEEAEVRADIGAAQTRIHS